MFLGSSSGRFLHQLSIYKTYKNNYIKIFVYIKSVDVANFFVEVYAELVHEMYKS